MTYRGDIPGFYYDNEKGKYFRIQPNHRVAPETAYSRQNVQAEKRIKKLQTRQHTRQQRRNHELIKRSPWVTAGRSIVGTRLGASPQENVDHIRFLYAQCLCQKCHVSGPPESSLWANFVFSRAGTFYGCTKERRTPFLVFTEDVTTYHPPFRDFMPQTPSAPCMALINDTFLICSWGTSVQIVSLNADGGYDQRGWLDVTYGHPPVHIWDVATAPHEPNYAFACSRGLYMGRATSLAAIESHSSQSLKREQRKVMFRDNNVIMSSERSGRINLTDLRVKESVTRLWHTDTVTGMTNTKNPNHIVVGGFSTVALYDLRFSASGTTKQSRSSDRRRPHDRPLLKFHFDPARAADRFPHGKQIDYISDLDIVVHATTHSVTDPLQTNNDVVSYVTLYSGSTGQILDSPLTKQRFHQAVDAIGVQKVRDGPDSIFVMTQQELQEWSLFDHENVSDRSDSLGKFDGPIVKGIYDVYRM